MEEDRLRDVISDLEIANRNLHYAIKRDNLSEHEKEIYLETYEMIKKSIQVLYEEEARMEVFNEADGLENE